MYFRNSINVRPAPGTGQNAVRILTLFGIFLITSQAVAQISQPRRFETIHKASDDQYTIISLKEEGLALFHDLNKYKEGSKTWQLTLLDTALQERKKLEILVKDRHKMVGYEVTPGHLYFLFRTGETTKNDFELIDIDLNGSEPVRFTFKPDLDFKLTHFSKAGDNFTFGGYVNNEPTVVLFEAKDNRIRVIPGFFQKNTELVDLRTNQNRTFNTVLMDRGSRENRKLIFRTFDETGKQLLEDVVPIDDEKSLQTGLTSTLEREDLVLLGTWGERNSKQSIGFYFMTVDPFNEQKIKYIDFGQLQHYLDYLNAKRAERIKENSKADMAQGRIPNFTTYIMPYRLIEHKNGFLLHAEVYTPLSTMSPYYSNPYYYNPYFSPYGYPTSSPFYYPGMSRMYRPYMYGNNIKNIEEIKSNQSVLLSFDAHGKVAWDQSMQLDEMKMPGIEQVSDFILLDDKICFLYKKESDIKMKTVLLGDGSATELNEKIKLSDEADAIKTEREFDGGVRHWIGNSFYVWGYHSVRNNSKDDRVRDVFYVNKVVAR
ncbi:MAG TPA: hypothetical protein VK589_27490 [Chryseolinea sp.]|nr:hypothetical protein [Chryseolinea sp.]